MFKKRIAHQFTILIDHWSLKDLLTHIIQMSEQQYYLAKLLGYDYKIQYKSGKANVVANALSRVYMNYDAQVFLLSIPQFEFMN